MPNGGKKNRNNRYRHQSDDAIQRPQSYRQNGGGGVSSHHKHYNKNKKIYFNPSIINDLNDDDYDRNTNNNNNNHNNNNNNNNRNDHRKSNKDRRKMADRLQDMGAKPKLSIGDSDVEVAKKLVESQPHCQISNMPKDVFDLIVNYVQNYFTCFDTKREDLLAAYHPKCTFSLSINFGNNQAAYRTFRFDDFVMRENRNLKKNFRMDDNQIEKCFRLQHRGKIDTLSVLCKLPPSEHDPRSFKLDVSFFSPNMITFSLSGVFKEGKVSDKVRPLRSFQRVFVCIPDTTSPMTIVNEQFTIANITSEQFKIYYQNVQQTLPVGTNQTTSAAAISAIPVVHEALIGLNEQQIQMIKEFSVNSRLNLEWSKHCLEHVGWVFDDAAKAFVQFKDSIPKEAFL